MQNEFDQRLKNMERELLDIKTASIYSSVKSAETSAGSQVRTGLYQITYESGDTNIMALMFLGYGNVYPRTPIGDTQIIEIATSGPPVDQSLRYIQPDYQLFLTAKCSVLQGLAEIVTI